MQVKQVGKPRKVHAELNDRLSNRFVTIKFHLGIQNDAEVLRFLIQHYFNEQFDTSERSFIRGTNPKEDMESIKKFFEKYGKAFKELGEE
jgi:hypothetical protein